MRLLISHRDMTGTAGSVSGCRSLQHAQGYAGGSTAAACVLSVCMGFAAELTCSHMHRAHVGGLAGGALAAYLLGPQMRKIDLQDRLFCLWDDPPIRLFANNTSALATYGTLIEKSYHIRLGFFWVKAIGDPESKKPPVHCLAFARKSCY